MEFGCATAPITTSLLEFFNPPKNLRIYISDIQTISFHYGTYKFRNYSNIKPILLVPANNFLLNIEKKMDVIFCVTVFEHLNKPLETVKIFYDILNKDGLLFFDYIKSDGYGLDTHHGVKERNEVLDFINTNFDIIHGSVLKDKSTGLTIAKKNR